MYALIFQKFNWITPFLHLPIEILEIEELWFHQYAVLANHFCIVYPSQGRESYLFCFTFPIFITAATFINNSSSKYFVALLHYPRYLSNLEGHQKDQNHSFLFQLPLRFL